MLQSHCRKGLGLKDLAELKTTMKLDKSDSLRCGDWEADPLPAKMVNVLLCIISILIILKTYITMDSLQGTPDVSTSRVSS